MDQLQIHYVDLGVPRISDIKSDLSIGRTEGNERELVQGDLEDIDGCDAVLAAFTAPDEGTAMEAWYAHGTGKRVVAYTGGEPAHPWTVYVAAAVCADLEDAVAALRG